MSRLGMFWWHQRRAFRSLFRVRRPLVLDLPALEHEVHPSTLCRCPNVAGVPHPIDLAHTDHIADCPWLAAMCKACSGTGWCQRCGGDGTEPACDQCGSAKDCHHKTSLGGTDIDEPEGVA